MERRSPLEHILMKKVLWAVHAWRGARGPSAFFPDVSVHATKSSNLFLQDNTLGMESVTELVTD